MKKFLYCITVCVLLLISVCAHAQEDARYIVKISEAGTDIPYEHLAKDLYITVGENQLAEALASYNVEYYEEDSLIQVDFPEPSPGEPINMFASNAGAWQRTGVNMSWCEARGHTGSGINIGVIDSGLAPSHYAFDYTHVKKGYDYWRTAEENENDYIMDDSAKGHGTFTSSMIIARNNGSIGVAMGANIVPLRVINSNGYTRNSYLVKAIYDAVDKFGCSVINISLGKSENQFNSTSDFNSYKEAADYAMKKGVIVVAAVGNYGAEQTGYDTLYYPAAYDSVIGVGAIDENGGRASFSQQNSSVWVSAPGQNVYGALYQNFSNMMGTWSGTSFSSPIVSGLTAILKSIEPDATFAQIKQILAETADDISPAGYDVMTGNGKVNFDSAVQKFAGNKKRFISPTTSEETGFFSFVRADSDLQANIIRTVSGPGGSFTASGEQKFFAAGTPEKVSVQFDRSGGESSKIYIWSSVENAVPVTKPIEE